MHVCVRACVRTGIRTPVCAFIIQVIFGTADQHQLTTTTANMAFVRAAAGQVGTLCSVRVTRNNTLSNAACIVYNDVALTYKIRDKIAIILLCINGVDMHVRVDATAVR